MSDKRRYQTKKAIMQSSDFWNQLKRQFSALGNALSERLDAKQLHDGSWHFSPTSNPIARADALSEFSVLATKGAIAARLPGQTLDAWLFELTTTKYFKPAPVSQEYGPAQKWSGSLEGDEVENIFAASCLLCGRFELAAVQETDANVAESDERPSVFPMRAQWLEAEMKARKMTVNRLSTTSGLARKTINRILSGSLVRDTSLPGIAKGLSQDGPPVSETDIPTD